MKLSLELKGLLLGMVCGAAATGLAFAAVEMIRPKPNGAATTIEGLVSQPARTQEGYRLFLMNCAHCHGNDARGDEGPDLHDLSKSDARIHQVITGGIKGEMPSFGKKLGEPEIRQLTAYLRTLHG